MGLPAILPGAFNKSEGRFTVGFLEGFFLDGKTAFPEAPYQHVQSFRQGLGLHSYQRIEQIKSDGGDVFHGALSYIKGIRNVKGLSEISNASRTGGMWKTPKRDNRNSHRY